MLNKFLLTSHCLTLHYTVFTNHNFIPDHNTSLTFTLESPRGSSRLAKAFKSPRPSASRSWLKRAETVTRRKSSDDSGPVAVQISQISNNAIVSLSHQAAIEYNQVLAY